MTHAPNIFSYIKSQLSILEVVQEYVSLKQSGNYWKGFSPFRSERVPSFTVSPAKGIYYCFSTNIGGDVIHFIAHMENCSQYEAAQHLIDRYHLTPPEHYRGHDDDKKTYHLVCSIFATWCHRQLWKNDRAHRYLTKRGFHDTVLSDFYVGYCPPRSTVTSRFIPFAQQHGIAYNDLVNAHIIKEGMYGAYSPFEDRIIFPIADHLGHICGFGGRTWKSRDQRAKYYNSQDHPYFHKSKLLYNIYMAKSHIHNSCIYLVEGYTDCLAMAAAGYYNTVATLGTACSTDHLARVARYASKLCILYDGDTAGQNALLRLTQRCWNVDLELSVVPLDPGEDPDTLASQGRISEKMQDTYDIFQFYIKHMGEQFLQKPLQERIQAARDVFTTIAQIQDHLKKDLLLQQAAQTFDIPFETVYKEIGPSSRPRKPQTSQRPQYLIEKCIIYVTLFYDAPFSYEDIPYIHYFLPDPIQSIFSKILEYKKQHETFNFDTFFANLNNKEQRIISKITAECDTYTKAIAPYTLLQQFYKKKWKEVVNRVKSHAHAQDTHTYQQALDDLYALKHHIVQRGLVWQPKSNNR